jgi:hypothetical protein
VQVEWKWCDRLNRDNVKHKFYTACNLWEEALLPSLKYNLCLSTWTTSKCHFSPRFSSENPKTKTFVVPKFWTLIFFSNQVYFEILREYLIAPKKIFPTMYNMPQSELVWPLFLRGLWLGIKLGINEQCKGILNIYVSKPF